MDETLQICFLMTFVAPKIKYYIKKIDLSSLLSAAAGFIEVRDSRTGYFIPVRYGLGLLPDGIVVGTSPPSSASSGNADTTKYKFRHNKV